LGKAGQEASGSRVIAGVPGCQQQVHRPARLVAHRVQLRIQATVRAANTAMKNKTVGYLYVRIGEGRALQADDVDLNAKAIRIARAFSEDGTLETPKSEHGWADHLP